MYHLAKKSRVQKKLQVYIYGNLSSEDLMVPTADQVKHLP